jgi:hypothetical protein
MPQEKDFKRLVRRRMAETGETYTQARLMLLGERAPKSFGGQDLLTLMTLPGVPGQENEGFLQMRSLPPDECRRIALRGLRHDNWRVRRRCAQLLDDLTLTEETIDALQTALRDEHPRVRQAALHSLICEHCKPDGCALDVRATAMSMLNDVSADVRTQAVAAFWLIDGDDVVDILRNIAENDRSPRVRRGAAGLVEWFEVRRTAEQSWHELPDELRRKTERHPGKWVAIADGRIVGAHRSWGQTRRSLAGVPHKESIVVRVPESRMSRAFPP